MGTSVSPRLQRPTFKFNFQHINPRLLFVNSTYHVTCQVTGIPLPKLHMEFKNCTSTESCKWYTNVLSQYNIPNILPVNHRRFNSAYQVMNGTFASSLVLRTRAKSTGTFRCRGHSKEGTSIKEMEYIVTDIPPGEDGVYIDVSLKKPTLPTAIPKHSRPHHDEPHYANENNFRSKRQLPNLFEDEESNNFNYLLSRKSREISSPSELKQNQLIQRDSMVADRPGLITAAPFVDMNPKIYTGDTLILTCKAQRYDYTLDDSFYRKATWEPMKTKIIAGGTIRYDTKETAYSNQLILTISNVSDEDSADYFCSARNLLTDTGLEKTTNIAVRVVTGPSIDPNTSSEAESHGKYKSPFTIRCDATGDPEPEISWFKDGVRYHPRSGVSFHDNNRNISFVRLVPDDQGKYECVAQNRIGRTQRVFKVDVQGGGGKGLDKRWVILIAILGVLAVLSIAVLLGCLIVMKKREKSRMELLGELYRQLKASAENTGVEIRSDIPIQAQTENLPYDFRYEVPKEHIKLESMLGHGQFGKVYKGFLTGRDRTERDRYVAVKSPAEGKNVDHQRALLSELKIMIFVGEHVNVVNLVGAVTKHMTKGELYVLMELCESGSLDNHLSKYRATFVNEVLPPNYDASHNQNGTDTGDNGYMTSSSIGKSTVNRRNSNNPIYRAQVDQNWGSNIYNRRQAREAFISTSDLISYAFQAANGMDFLEAKNLIHRDLAARNLLLTADGIVKITDFGLARQEPTYQIKSKDIPLPFKWTAVETLRYLEYTSKSDVWSFGITMWEIFSLGESPYPGMQLNSDFIEYIKAGNRMGPPPNAPAVIYNLMQSCWQAEPSARPNFSHCRELLGEQLAACSSVLYNQIYVTLSEPRSSTTENGPPGRNRFVDNPSQLNKPPNNQMQLQPAISNDEKVLLRDGRYYMNVADQESGGGDYMTPKSNELEMSRLRKLS